MAMQRFWEIDFARGFAVLMMVLFNWLFALGYFSLISFDASQGFWWAFARVTAGLFVFIAGLSFTLSFERNPSQKIVLRGLKLFALGMAITLATALFLKSGFIVFGILHLIGFSTIVALAFARLGSKALLSAGALAVAAGILLSQFSFSFPWLLWLGFVPRGFYTLDYFPLLPWFGVFLFGMAFSKKFYSKNKRRFALKENANGSERVFRFLGRHSLAIYLLHQPLLIAVLYALGINPLGF